MTDRVKALETAIERVLNGNATIGAHKQAYSDKTVCKHLRPVDWECWQCEHETLETALQEGSNAK